MAGERHTDIETARTWFWAGSRVFADRGQWYFNTREGNVEGPYADKQSAERFLESYVQVISSKFVPSTDFGLMLREDGAYAAPVARSADSPDLGLGRLIQAR